MGIKRGFFFETRVLGGLALGRGYKTPLSFTTLLGIGGKEIL